MRSGRGEKSQPESPRRPSMRSVEVPAPSIRPPQRFRNSARSEISGSRAAPRRTVVPRAQTAASSKVSVAPTLGKRRVMSAPWRPPGAASTSFPAPASSSLPPSGPDLPDVSRWDGRRYCTRRAAKSRPGPAAPAAVRRRGWRPAFVPRFLPEGCCLRASRPPQCLPPASRQHTLRPAAARGCIPRPTASARPAAAPVPGRAVPPQGAEVRCFSPPVSPPCRSAAVRPSPKSARSAVSYPLPPFRKRYPTICKSRGGCHAGR